MEKEIITPTEPRKVWAGVPGFKSFDRPVTVREALEEIRGNFEVEKQPLMKMPERVMTSILNTGRVPSDITLSMLSRMVIKTHRATVNTRDDETLGVVGEDYGIVQNTKPLNLSSTYATQMLTGANPSLKRVVKSTTGRKFTFPPRCRITIVSMGTLVSMNMFCFTHRTTAPVVSPL